MDSLGLLITLLLNKLSSFLFPSLGNSSLHNWLCHPMSIYNHPCSPSPSHAHRPTRSQYSITMLSSRVSLDHWHLKLVITSVSYHNFTIFFWYLVPILLTLFISLERLYKVPFHYLTPLHPYPPVKSTCQEGQLGGYGSPNYTIITDGYHLLNVLAWSSSILDTAVKSSTS